MLKYVCCDNFLHSVYPNLSKIFTKTDHNNIQTAKIQLIEWWDSSFSNVSCHVQ